MKLTGHTTLSQQNQPSRHRTAPATGSPGAAGQGWAQSTGLGLWEPPGRATTPPSSSTLQTSPLLSAWDLEDPVTPLLKPTSSIIFLDLHRLPCSSQLQPPHPPHETSLKACLQPRPAASPPRCSSASTTVQSSGCHGCEERTQPSIQQPPTDLTVMALPGFLAVDPLLLRGTPAPVDCGVPHLCPPSLRC